MTVHSPFTIRFDGLEAYASFSLFLCSIHTMKEKLFGVNEVSCNNLPCSKKGLGNVFEFFQHLDQGLQYTITNEQQRCCPLLKSTKITYDVEQVYSLLTLLENNRMPVLKKNSIMFRPSCITNSKLLVELQLLLSNTQTEHNILGNCFDVQFGAICTKILIIIQMQVCSRPKPYRLVQPWLLMVPYRVIKKICGV